MSSNTQRTLVEADLPGVGYVQWTRVTEWEYDADYGDDADGNRGVPMWGDQDEEPEDVQVRVDDGDWADPPAHQLPAILAAIDAYQKQHGPEYEEPYDPREDE